ncbi:amidohydrolase family protein, partial [bacterium]|nr:amidohydrolase family protein [bacterium]
IKFTSYSRSVIYTLKKFYGYDDLNEKNYREISEKVQERNKKGIYREVLRETCNIEKSLTQCARTDVDKCKDPILIPVMPLSYLSNTPDYTEFSNPPDWIKKYFKSKKIENIDDFLENMKLYLKKIKEEGAVGVKTRSYPQTYPPQQPDRKKAEEDFKTFKKEGKLPKVNYLFDYLMNELISFAIEEDFVIAVHTGYWGDFRDLNPLHLIPILERHPEGRFDVYHFGYPWIRETIMLGKGFSNVYLNFCWLHIISQKAAKEALDEVIETVPWNKIIGFGGDYRGEAVEKVYGHLKMAKEDIAEVVGKRIETGYMKYEEGVKFIKSILYDNPKNLYKI